MTHHFEKIVLACMTSAMLAACGGGSSSSAERGLTSLDDLPENGVTELQGQAVSTETIADPGIGGVRAFNLTQIDSSTVELTTEDGEIVLVSVDALGSTADFDLTIDNALPNNRPYSEFRSFEDGTYLMIINRETGVFEHQTVGIWAEGITDQLATVGGGAYGFKTKNSEIPVGQAATYRGSSAGYSFDELGSAFVTISDVLINTDFRNVAIDSTNTMAFFILEGPAGIALPSLDFSGTGIVADSGFVADVAATSLTGEASGTFHGPAAEEVGGTFRLTGQDGATYIGAFGAD